MVMCQCRYSNCSKCTTLAGAVDSGGGCACEEGRGYKELVLFVFSVLSAQFCCEPKTALKIKAYF